MKYGKAGCADELPKSKGTHEKQRETKENQRTECGDGSPHSRHAAYHSEVGISRGYSAVSSVFGKMGG